MRVQPPIPRRRSAGFRPEAVFGQLAGLRQAPFDPVPRAACADQQRGPHGRQEIACDASFHEPRIAQRATSRIGKRKADAATRRDGDT